jgi:membrane protease YdiL (CAAX protease family)
MTPNAGRLFPLVSRSLPVVLYLAAYALTLFVMHAQLGFGVVEPLFVLLVFGVALSLLAWWTTRAVKPRDITVAHPQQETTAVAVYLLVVVAFITWGLPAVRVLSVQPVAQSLLVTASKLLVFVLVPLVLWRRLWQYRLPQFVDLPAGLRGHWRAAVLVSLALLILQAVVGRAPKELTALHPHATELLVSLLITGPWLFVEVGIVEEFFFRGLLQARLAAVTRSELSGLVLAAVLFGLAHAPGFYLRPAATGEALGAHPTLLMVIGYSVVITSVTGFFMGILWIRTRNLLLLAVVHTAGDLLPNLAETIRLWRPH